MGDGSETEDAVADASAALLRLIRLSRAQFDMRCAKALTHDLEKFDGSATQVLTAS